MGSRSVNHILRVAAQAERFQVEHGGCVVPWRRFGRGGRPLVLLHGGHGNWMHWLNNVEALSKAREVWVPDMPGFGDSTGEVPQVESEKRLGWIEAMLQATLEKLPLASRGFDLVGFSFGAVVATGLALKADVARLALIGPVGHGTARQRDFVLLPWQEARNAQEAEAVLKHNLQTLMLTGEVEDDPLALAIHELGCRTCRVRTRAISRMGLLPSRLDLVNQPVLAIWGERDLTGIPLKAATAMRMQTGQRQWRVVQGAAHWVQYQRPELVNQWLGEWFFENEGAKE